jgi:hypothetical protein
MLDMGLQFQINPITHRKFSLCPLFVSLKFHTLLSSGQMLLYQVCHIIAVLQPLLKVWDRASVCGSDAKMSWFVAIENLKWCGAMRGVIGGVVPVLG